MPEPRSCAPSAIPVVGLCAARNQLQHRAGTVRIEIFVVIVVDPDHGSVYAGSEAFDLSQRELAVRPGFAQSDAQRFLTGLNDFIASPEPARRRCTDLHQGLADGLQVYHRVKGRDLVDTYGRHIQILGDRADHLRGHPASVVPLNEIQNG